MKHVERSEAGQAQRLLWNVFVCDCGALVEAVFLEVGVRDIEGCVIWPGRWALARLGGVGL